MRALTLTLLLLPLAACQPTLDTSDYIKIQGELGDGKQIKNKKFAGSCGMAKASSDGVSDITALGVIINSYENLEGVRLELFRGRLAAGMTYQASPTGPIAAYAIWPDDDAGALGLGESPLGGTITLSKYSEIEGDNFDGTLSGLTSSDGPVAVTIDSGSFQGHIP